MASVSSTQKDLSVFLYSPNILDASKRRVHICLLSLSQPQWSLYLSRSTRYRGAETPKWKGKHHGNALLKILND